MHENKQVTLSLQKQYSLEVLGELSLRDDNALSSQLKICVQSGSSSEERRTPFTSVELFLKLSSYVLRNGWRSD